MRLAHEPSDPKAISDLLLWLERAERLRTQQRVDKNRPNAPHAPADESNGKGKARNPSRFRLRTRCG